MTFAQVPTFEADRLGQLIPLGADVTGRLFTVPAVRLNRVWPAVYKEYDSAAHRALDVDALGRTAALLTEIGDDAGRWLAERAAWPAALITRGGAVTGYLARRLPEQFTRTAGDLLGDLPGVDDRARLEFLHDLAETLAALDRWGVAPTVLSPGAVLFSASGRPRCFLTGCDAMRVNGSAALTVGAPDDAGTLDRLVLRVLAQDPATVDPGRIAERYPNLAAVARRGTGPAGWVAPLAAAVPAASPAFVPVAPAPPSIPPPVPPARERRRTAIVVAAVAFVALIGAVGVAGAAVLGRDQDPAPPAAAGPAPSATGPAPAGRGEAPAAAPTPSPVDRVGLVDVSAVAQDQRALGIGGMFDQYFASINAKDYDRAMAVYDPAGAINPADPAHRQRVVDGVSTTTDSDVRLVAIAAGTGAGVAVQARVTFQSNQQAGYGPKGREQETCTRWNITYALSSPADREYRILRTVGAANQPCN